MLKIFGISLTGAAYAPDVPFMATLPIKCFINKYVTAVIFDHILPMYKFHL